MFYFIIFSIIIVSIITGVTLFFIWSRGYNSEEADSQREEAIESFKKELKNISYSEIVLMIIEKERMVSSFYSKYKPSNELPLSYSGLTLYEEQIYILKKELIIRGKQMEKSVLS
jgi:hypothetical protein